MCQHVNTMFTATSHIRDTHVQCGAVQHKRIHPQAQLQARFTVVRTIESMYIKHKRKKNRSDIHRCVSVTWATVSRSYNGRPV